MFSILGDMEKYENILDAFAGTGAIGIEAFSRGAKHIDFIDERNEYNPIQTDDTDSNYSFNHNSDAIISNFRNRRRKKEN